MQKIKWQEVRETTEKVGNGQLLSGRGFVQNIVPPSFSRGNGIKKKQTIKQTNNYSIKYINK